MRLRRTHQGIVRDVGHANEKQPTTHSGSARSNEVGMGRGTDNEAPAYRRYCYNNIRLERENPRGFGSDQSSSREVAEMGPTPKQETAGREMYECLFLSGDPIESCFL